MTTNSGLTRRLPIASTEPRGGFVGRLANMLLAWQQRARERHMLGQLDDRALSDLGLSRADVETEVRKSFWQP